MEKLISLSMGWDSSFYKYWVNTIDPDIDRIGKWNWEHYQVPSMTTNQSESLNAVIKDLNNWKEVSHEIGRSKSFVFVFLIFSFTR